MNGYQNSLVLVDQQRAQFFAESGEWAAAARKPQHWRDADGVRWSGQSYAGTWLAWSWLGRGWVFEPLSKVTLSTQVATRVAAHRAATEDQHRLEQAIIARQVRLGAQAGRLLWHIHLALMTARSSVLTVPEYALAAAVWGPDRYQWPRHWRGQVLIILNGLTWVHLADGGPDAPPRFGSGTVLLTHVNALRGLEDQDVCDSTCPGRNGPPHHHVLINVGRGFLGVLEPFARDVPERGERVYDFSRTNRGGGPKLREVGRTGRLVSVFWPAELSHPGKLNLAARQRRLLRAIVREQTRPARRTGRSMDLSVVRDARVPNRRGTSGANCPLLDAAGSYAAFNGNGHRRGLGYKLMSPRGWLTRSGYDAGDIDSFLADLGEIAGPLGLVPVGLASDLGWLDLPALTGLAATASGRRRLSSVHLRVYGPVDWKTRWPEVFHGMAGRTSDAAPRASDGADLAASLLATGLSQRALASAVGLDASFLGKLLNGKKRWPSTAIDRARVWLSSTCAQPVPPPALTAAAAARPSNDTAEAVAALAGPRDHGLLPVASWYAAQGWSVVPVIAGTKKPFVSWTPYQSVRPTPDQLSDWAKLWPNAGLAVVLGPVSGLLVIDVDGVEADEVLVKRLGAVPRTPTVISGSREPGRYHLYFRLPDGLQAGAKKTPWHPKLEFRGRGGLAVLPPSRHKTGNQYAWADGLAPDQIELADVPVAVVEALLGEMNRPDKTAGVAPIVDSPPDDWVVSDSTRKFLQGEFANGPQWNDRMFRAACDLRARLIPLERAEPALLRGAAPRTPGDQEQALLTIRSAYSRDRVPSKK